MQEQGWAELQNGALLTQASSSFDVLLTNDQRMRHQQNLSRFEIGVVVIAAGGTRLRDLRPLLPRIRMAIAGVSSHEVEVVERL